MVFMLRVVVCGALAAAAMAQAAHFVPAPLPAGITQSARKAAVGDCDRDGDLDLYVAQSAFWTPLPGLFMNDGAGSLTDVSAVLPVTFDLQPMPAFVDIDSDGDLDLYISQGMARLFRNDGPGPWTDLSGTLPAGVTIFRSLAVGDFDGDGDADIAGTGFSIGIGSNRLLVNGPSGFTYIDPFPGQGGVILALDFDGDADLDVYVGGFTARLWRNDGAMTFTEVTATHLPAIGGVNSGVAGDVDADGDPDLVLGSNTGADMLLRNVGGTFVLVPGAVPAATSGNGAMLLVDVDADADLDLIRSFNQTGTLARNDGSGTFTLAPNGAIPGLGSAHVIAADFDGDGDDDLIAGDYSTGGSLWWNRHRHVGSTAPPVRGQTWTVEVWSQPGYGTSPRVVELGIGLARLPQPWLLPPFGALWLDFAAPLLLVNGIAPAGLDVAPFSFAIPATPAIAGIVLHAQALIAEGPGAVDLRLTAVLSTPIQ